MATGTGDQNASKNRPDRQEKMGEVHLGGGKQSTNSPGLDAPFSAKSRAIFEALTRVSLMLEANDSAVDDLLSYLNDVQSPSGVDKEASEQTQASNDALLSEKASQILDERKSRFLLLPKALRDGPIINMLLFLYVEQVAGRKVSSKTVCYSAGCPDTSALRRLDRLESEGLIARRASTSDGRVTHVSLTEGGEELASKLIQVGSRQAASR